jgi:hypothetical protein
LEIKRLDKPEAIYHPLAKRRRGGVTRRKKSKSAVMKRFAE